MNTNDADKNKGLYPKYRVERTDGSSAPGGKHEKCRYFVLDLDHDPHAKLALKGYVISCRQYYPELAKDLDDVIEELERRKQSNVWPHGTVEAASERLPPVTCRTLFDLC